MAFWDEVKEKAAWAAEQVGEKIEEATEAGKTEYQVLKVKRQIDAMEEEVGELMKKFGRRAFELHEGGGLEDEELGTIAAEIRAKREKVGELEKEVEEARKEHEEFKKKKAEKAEERAAAAEERRQDKEDGIDGEAIWEDDEDDGTPPPP